MLLIFDLDGTLFQSKPVVMLAVRRLLEEMGFPSPDDGAILKNLGRGAIEMLSAVLPDGADAETALSVYFDQIRIAIFECGELFPGVRAAVQQLRAEGHELYISSKSPLVYIEAVLEHTGIAGFFSKCCSSENFSSKAEAIRQLIGQDNPATPAIVIGDTHGDVEAAHLNGLPAIAAMYGYGNKQLLAGAEYFADSPEDIVKHVTAHALNTSFHK